MRAFPALSGWSNRRAPRPWWSLTSPITAWCVLSASVCKRILARSCASPPIWTPRICSTRPPGFDWHEYARAVGCLGLGLVSQAGLLADPSVRLQAVPDFHLPGACAGTSGGLPDLSARTGDLSVVYRHPDWPARCVGGIGELPIS